MFHGHHGYHRCRDLGKANQLQFTSTSVLFASIFTQTYYTEALFHQKYLFWKVEVEFLLSGPGNHQTSNFKRPVTKS